VSSNWLQLTRATQSLLSERAPAMPCVMRRGRCAIRPRECSGQLARIGVRMTCGWLCPAWLVLKPAQRVGVWYLSTCCTTTLFRSRSPYNKSMPESRPLVKTWKCIFKVLRSRSDLLTKLEVIDFGIDIETDIAKEVYEQAISGL